MPMSSHARIPVYVAAGLPPIAVALFWLSSVPPLWLYLDSTAILLWPSAQVPHFPPLLDGILCAYRVNTSIRTAVSRPALRSCCSLLSTRMAAWTLANFLRVGTRTGIGSARISYFRIYRSAVFYLTSCDRRFISVSVAKSWLGLYGQCDYMLPLHWSGPGGRLTGDARILPRMGKRLLLFDHRTAGMPSHLRKL